MLALLVVPCSLARLWEGKARHNYVNLTLIIMFYSIGSYFWGVLSDRKGRKPVLITSAICMGLSTLMFGFSVNFAMAVVSRFLVGIANGEMPGCEGK